MRNIKAQNIANLNFLDIANYNIEENSIKKDPGIGINSNGIIEDVLGNLRSGTYDIGAYECHKERLTNKGFTSFSLGFKIFLNCIKEFVFIEFKR